MLQEVNTALVYIITSNRTQEATPLMQLKSLLQKCLFLTVQAGLVLCQGYIPKKMLQNQIRANRTQNSHLKQGLGDFNLYGVRLYH